VVTLIAETLGIPESRVELRGGTSSRSKRVAVTGVPVEELRRALELALEDGNAGGGPSVRPGAR
jgi:uncharacterized protein YggU (UPF0235/DUF167 family)